MPISEFAVDDIRFMIVQGVGLRYLLTEAIELLSQNLLTEGNYYEGDLLNVILKLDKGQWAQAKELWDKVDVLINGQVDHLKTLRPKLEIDNFYNSRPK